MKLAAQIGINITDFWEMTPAELNIYADAYIEKINAESELNHNNLILHAYLLSRWVWQKTVDFKKYFIPSQRKEAMSDEEMLHTVKVLNAIMGGNVENIKRWG